MTLGSSLPQKSLRTSISVNDTCRRPHGGMPSLKNLVQTNTALEGSELGAEFNIRLQFSDWYRVTE